MNTLTEDDDNTPDTDELIPVETPPEAEEAEDDDQDEEDERLAQSEDDHEDDIASSSNRDRRRKRREIQKKARDAAQRELEELRRTVAVLSQRVAQTETQSATAAATTAEQTIEQRLAQTLRDIQQAEAIMAKAAEAGNGDDMVAAMKIRDQAMQEAQQLQYNRQQVQQAKQQATQPRVDPQVVNYAKEWMQANPWYDPNAGDRDSALTKAIDNELAREGYDPASRIYWEELTTRVADALSEKGGDEAARAPRRKAPPTGNTREHAPASTKKEIYVTPERKQAMIEAGVWDDPVARNRYLKAYQEYDRGNSAR
ncbi:MAG: hypothetical protein RLZZ387_2624 [Chloroflexota bacterium]|jgi:hypothetical protein